MTITDYCEHCGAKFQIDNTTISECEKKNKWNCHCPGCHIYIDVKKYEFMFTESKTNDSAVAVSKGLPQVFKMIYQILQILWYSSLIAMSVGLVCLVIDVIVDVIGKIKIFPSLGIIALYVGIGLALAVILVYIMCWFTENFVKLVEKR